MKPSKKIRLLTDKFAVQSKQLADAGAPQADQIALAEQFNADFKEQDARQSAANVRRRRRLKIKHAMRREPKGLVTAKSRQRRANALAQRVAKVD